MITRGIFNIFNSAPVRPANCAVTSMHISQMPAPLSGNAQIHPDGFVVTNSVRRVTRSAPVSNGRRIAYIDGLRCLAILGVILYHYLYRWTLPLNPENLYPYGDAFSALGQYGNFGVQLFFIVSGFVITMTLGRCSSALEFAARRFARLWPPMLLCSLLTAVLVRIIPDNEFKVPLSGFVPSLTFLSPRLWNSVLHVHNLAWIDGSYWSLFVEVRFYIFVALVFFLFKDRFAQVIFTISVVIAALTLTGAALHLHKVMYALNLVAGVDFMPWFMMGIAFFWIHNRANGRLGAGLLAVAVGTIVISGVSEASGPMIIAAFLIPSIFVLGSPGKPLHRLLSNKFVTSVGVSSYSLYLLHQNIGVALICYFGKILHLQGKSSVAVAIAVTFVMAALSKIIYLFWEHPMNHKIIGRVVGCTGKEKRLATLS